MNSLSDVVALLVNLISSFAIADSSVVPLDQIWAYQMPGTRNIDQLDKTAKEHLVSDIFMAQFKRADKMFFKNVARHGFAFSGDARAALEASHAVFVDNAKPKDVFSAKDDVTIVFFSEPTSGNHLRIKQVTRKDNQVEIQYQLEPFFESHLSEDFALIPLGELPVAKYHIDMKQLPLDSKFSKLGRKPIDEESTNNALCKSFSFSVTEKTN